MKKVTSLCLASILAISVLAGCNNKPKNSGNSNTKNSENNNANSSSVLNVSNQVAPEGYVNPNAVKDEDVFMQSAITLDLDTGATVYTFDELYNNSKIVMEFTVKEATPVVSESGSLDTLITPEDVKLFKGQYNGEKIKTMGGVMKYDEYMAYPQVAKMFELRQDPNAKNQDTSNKYFRSESMLEPIYTKGDRVLVFLKDHYTGEQGLLQLSHFYQSSFLVNGNVVENRIIAKEHGEPLFAALNKEFPNKLRGAENFQFNKSDFVSKLESYSK